MLTDVVLGAWTSSFLLDLIPGRRTRKASDRLVDIGILAAAPTALAGLSDWADTWGGPAGWGWSVASANTVALYLYVSSSVARKRGRRLWGWWLSMTGFGVITTSAYLGGHLSLGKGIGVNQTAFDEGPTDWRPAIADADLPEGSPTPVTVGAVPLLPVRRGATIYAISNRCNHRGCLLHDGDFSHETSGVPVPREHLQPRGRSAASRPGHAPQPLHLTRVRDGKVEVRMAHA